MCCETFGMPIIILRINNIYGPNQWDVKVVPCFIEVAKNKKKFTVQGTGKQLRSWLYVDDASEAIRQVIEHGKLHEIYNVGTYFEMNVPVEFVSVPDRPYNDQRYLLDYTKINKELGWSPQIPFEEGIRRVVASSLSARKSSQKMRVIIYGGTGWIGQQCCKKMFERNIPFVLAECRIGKNSDEEKMRVVIYGGTGWIGQQCCKKMFERNIPFVLAECRIGKNSDEEV
ncbi:unnamed protein product [Gongylonema pulchrum]|uniref:Epimerase domain-containing protein n=1 Tax=Gongylonema pulchrum TaxID=637853 RepID=A0A183E716_9BILA|nr:unnamed protein product [Gongylonema pulchrum]